MGDNDDQADIEKIMFYSIRIHLVLTIKRSENMDQVDMSQKTALIWHYNPVGQTKICRFYRYTYLDFYNAGSLKQQPLGR